MIREIFIATYCRSQYNKIKFNNGPFLTPLFKK